MSQSDLNIANVSRSLFRQEVNEALQALGSLSSGATEPSTTYAYQLWADTGSGLLKQRNAANDGWINKGNLADVDWGFLNKAGGSMSGLLQLDQSTNIVAAATTNLGNATGNAVTVTHASGTVAITSFGGTSLQSGTELTITWSVSGGSLSVTHNATSLILPSGADLPIANGDVWRVQKISDSQAYWRVIDVTKADGTPVVGGGASILGDSKNLIITNNSGTPNSQVDIDADEIILKDSSGRAYLAEAVNLTANIASSGTNGLDTGTEANSTWYYLWVIYNPTTDTVASLISASSTAPTLPSGYTYKALVGAIYNDGSSNFIKYRQVDKDFWTDRVTISTSTPGTSYGSVSLSTAIPPNSRSANLMAIPVVTAGSNPSFYHSPNNGDDLANIHTPTAGVQSASSNTNNFTIPIITAQTIYTKRAGTAPLSYALYCHGGKY